LTRRLIQARQQKKNVADIQRFLRHAMQIIIQKFLQRFHELRLGTENDENTAMHLESRQIFFGFIER
jgi:hypothetical protein